MQIERLRCFQFRNLAKIEMPLEGGMVFLQGKNAQGKTNLLEALYLCATGKSFRRASASELIRHEAEGAWVEADFIRQDVRHRIKVEITPKKKLVSVDDRVLRRASRLLELINVVAFFPDDLRLIKGSPDERRRFLDRAVANQYPEFVDASIAYAKVLKTRNSLLKKMKPERDLLSVYDDQLIEHGVVIDRCRRKAIDALRPGALHYFSTMMGEQTPLSIGLQSGLGSDVEEVNEETFRAALAQSFERDAYRGITHRGVHRADLIFRINEQSAQQFASQGQQRTIVLSLKLAEVVELKERLACAPILLLDDVSSELDRERTEILFQLIDELGCQVWISTTGSTILPQNEGSKTFFVHDGHLREESFHLATENI